LFEKVEGLVGLVPTLERVIPIPLDGRVAFGDETLSPDFGWRDNSPAAGAPGKVVALLPTGGTTGAPKAARLTNRNVTASAVASMLAHDLTPADRILVALPLFHVGGAFCGCPAAFAAGATVIVPTAAGLRNPEVVANYWRIVEAQRATVGGLVPTGLGAVAETPLAGADISRLRLFTPGPRSARPRSNGAFSPSGRATASVSCTA
jgi:fatty-acyl-CoA synthase